jgi:hypothetical protein
VMSFVSCSNFVSLIVTFVGGNAAPKTDFCFPNSGPVPNPVPEPNPEELPNPEAPIVAEAKLGTAKLDPKTFPVGLGASPVSAGAPSFSFSFSLSFSGSGFWDCPKADFCPKTEVLPNAGLEVV